MSETWAIRRRNGGVDINDAMADDLVRVDYGEWVEVVEKSEVERLREAAKRVLEADMLGVRDLDALNALEDAAGFTQQGQRKS